MKKSEKLSEAMGNLSEEIIEKADQRRTAKTSKKGGRLTLKIAAATAACLAAVIVTVTFVSQGISAEELAVAVYPEASEYPSDININHDSWTAEQRGRWEKGKLIDSSVKDFYKKTAEEFLSGDENKAYSPVNVYMALAMLGETTDGESRRQILDLLGVDNIEGLREDAKNMWLANYCNDGAVTSILANSVWLNKDVNIKQQTVDVLAENYYASSYRGDTGSPKMTNAVQTWLNQQTNELLSDSVKNVSLDPETIMALYSTVYFRAKWDNQFDKSKNDTKTFHAPKVDIQTEFMNDTETYGWFYGGEDFGAMFLNFKEGGKMWFILPDEDKTTEDVLSSGEYIKMMSNPDEWKNSKMLKIHYSVPKYDISSQIKLSEGLKNLGVTDIFDIEKSDFSPLTDSAAFISEANHTARVVIDEEGCTATAFTEMITSGAALPPEDEMDFILDRPFIFAVTSDTQQPLFIGTVNNPQ